MNKIDIVKNYIKDRLTMLLLIGMTVIVYLSVYFIYNIDMEPVLYATYLICLILVFDLFYGFYRYYKKHIHLIKIKDNILYSDGLPKKTSLMDCDYQELIVKLKKIYFKNASVSKEQFQEMEDYFTLWVHQIKLPISAMKLLIEMESNPDKKLLKSELFRINQYSDMVLAYLRIKSTDTDYVFKSYDLDELVRQAIRKFSFEFIRKKIRIDFDETNMKVLTDEKWLVFVLEQLLSNAMKYTNEGNVHIYGYDSTLFIEDTGIGIDPSDLPRVFEKGFTGFNGRSDKQASGLGLYLCKSIMNKLSHGIEIESQVNKGTKVILYLKHEDLRVE
ncbi:MAG: HAMP domain-containing histidine kinase [Erysipelotrichaceae bacterium]|nr:HAMP domain-containing histidine kinase [Erysipelotrichaceae bacterium]